MTRLEMKNSWIYLLYMLLLISQSSSNEPKEEKMEELDAEARLDRLSEEVRDILEHYKDPDPVGLPNDPIPDPMPIPNMKHSFSFTTMTLKNVTVHGLSKFRIDNAFSDLVDMQKNELKSDHRKEPSGGWFHSRFPKFKIKFTERNQVTEFGGFQLSARNVPLLEFVTWFLSENCFSRLRNQISNATVSMGVKMDNLMVFGNHTMSTWLSSSSGGFNVTLVGIYVEGLATLEVARGGYLEATDIKMDIVFQDIEMDFQNLGLMGSIFQGMVNSVGTFIFDSIKPYILSQINLRAGINKNLRDLPQTFPNSIPPLDLAIAEGRKYVRNKGLDPYKIDDYHYSSHLLTLDITHTWLYGLASFYRVGNITASMEKNALDIVIHVGTQRLEGTCQWEAATVMSFLSKNGMTSFSIEYFHVYARINQTLDTRNHPTLNDLQLKLGNIQLQMEGTGTLDYILELLVNVLPNVLRYQIMDAVEIPLKRRIQEILNSIDVSKLIEENMNNLVASKKNQTEIQSVTMKPFDEEGLVIHGKALNEDMNQNVSVIAR